MNEEQRLLEYLTRLIMRKPLSFAIGALSGFVIISALYLRLKGHMYIEQLNWIDATTPILIGMLLLRGLYAMRDDTDLQAVSMALIGALSFVFAYEAIYKLSFYGFPWRMSPAELREFTTQCGISLTALAGFAYGKYRLSKPSQVFLGLFVLLYGSWILIGFPQLETGRRFYVATVDIPLTWNGIYVVNRTTKVLMFLAYFFFYTTGQRCRHAARQSPTSPG